MTTRSLTEVRNETCQDCILHETAEFVCLTGYGKIPSDIMIIGEAPGHREDESGVPFVGKIGKILDVILEEVGISREDIYITNVVHCRPPDNRTPKMEEMKACRKYLLREIKKVKPTTIIVLGNIALKGLFKDNYKSISKERGRILDFKYKTGLIDANGEPVRKKVKVIVTYHPGAAARKRYYANLIYEDIKNGLDNTSRTKVETHSNYILVDQSNKDKFFDRLFESPIIAADLETSSLDPFDKKEEIRTVNMSIKPYESYIWKAKYIDYIRDILMHKELIVNHNIKFDLEWLNREGIKPTCRIFDTMVAKHLLDENCPDKELGSLGTIELGMGEQFRFKDSMKHHWKNKTIPTWEEYRLCGVDSDTALQLYLKYKDLLKKEGLDNLMSTEMKVLKTLTRMEIQGFKIDRRILKRLTSEYSEEIEKIYSELVRLVGDINLNSPKQLVELLYNDLKFPILKRTDNKEPSTDEDTLTKLSNLEGTERFESKVLRYILAHRKVSKLYNTYLVGIVKNGQLKEDDKLHCNFKIAGTVTGRLSCSEPNLQNIPREGDIKEMFISSFSGGVIVKADYSQIELRLLAHYANDKKLIQAFKEGRDIHKETTSKCLHKPYDQVTEEERKVIGKRVNFGIIYQISAPGLAVKIGCSTKKAQGYIDNWFEEFYLSKQWMRDKKEEIIATGRSISFTGRIRRLYGVDPSTSEGREAIRQGINSPIQGGAGDITKFNMMRLDRKLKKEGYQSRVICNVHDEIDIDCHPKEVKDIVKISKTLLVEPPVTLRIPLEVEIMVGKNWSKSAMRKEVI